MTSLALSRPTPTRRPAADLTAGFRLFLATGAAVVTLPILYALARAATGVAPGGGALKEVALAVHLATVVPALPLGAFVLLGRKGDPRHRLLGRVWLCLMLVAAISALGIRHINNGSFSAIHLLVPVVLVGSWRVVATARRGDIRAHRRTILLMFTGGLLLPAVLAFAPGRLMWTWLLG